MLVIELVKHLDVNCLVVVVENGRFGATNAVPIGKLMFEKFFYGEVLPGDQYLEDMIANRVILPNVYIKNSRPKPIIRKDSISQNSDSTKVIAIN